MNPIINNVNTLPLRQPDTSEVSRVNDSFSEMVKNSFKQVNDSLNEGDNAIKALHTGEAQNLHEVMIAVEQADISLRMFVQMRNKALQAYEEIMRLQI
ncbi:MAG: flagellar hook-basal body complex protein FliE [Desulfobulbaceae bacterium]|nr:MAG: flagellar hook-basal body complex protein FliE [Desulfobulbaceae bacterium]